MSDLHIVGYDGSDAADAAVRFAARLAEATDGEVLLAAVYATVERIYAKGYAEGTRRAIDEDAQAEAERTLAAADVAGATRCVVDADSPAEGLQRLAEERHAAMLVVGVTHHGVLGRIVPGSVGEHLLHGAPCAVAVVPAGGDDAPIRAVAVAFRDTPEALAALRVAERLARTTGARLVVLTVRETPLAYTAAGPVSIPLDLEADVEERLELEARDAVDTIGTDVEAEIRVLAGAAGPALVDACAVGVDVLVTGSRGYGPARSVLTGTVSRHLVDHAPCPVVVVPRGVPVAPATEPAVATA